MFAHPARDLPELCVVGGDPAGWLDARQDLSTALRTADELVAGWGLLPLTGPARIHRDMQIRWLVDEAKHAGHEFAWAVGAQARHPSRWHQFVSDRHGRTSPGTFEDRLREVLVRTPLAVF